MSRVQKCSLCSSTPACTHAQPLVFVFSSTWFDTHAITPALSLTKDYFTFSGSSAFHAQAGWRASFFGLPLCRLRPTRARPTGVSRNGHVKQVGVVRRMGGLPWGGAPRRATVAVADRRCLRSRLMQLRRSGRGRVRRTERRQRMGGLLSLMADDAGAADGGSGAGLSHKDIGWKSSGFRHEPVVRFKNVVG